MARERSTIDKLIKRQIKLTILSVIAVIIITSTITYALYQTNHENTTDQVISIGNLGLTATGTPITLEGLYPMEEYDLTSSYPSYNFTLENKTNGVNNDYTLMYELVLRADENTTLSQDDYQYIMYKIDGSEAKPLSEVWDSDINGFKILDGRLLSHEETTLSSNLANKDIENHSIVFWLSTYAPNSVQGKVLTLKMSLEAYADRFNYLKYYEYAENNVFGKTLNRSDFESITTLDKIEIPDSAIESWDVSNKQNKSIMAWYTDIDNNGLYELYIGQFGKVVANPNCNMLFYMYTASNVVDVSHLDTSIVTSMNNMFGGTYISGKDFVECINKIIGLEKFDTSNVTNMERMFSVSKVSELNVSNFDTSKVIKMGYMFYDCARLTELDLSNFDTTSVTDMGSIFQYCTNMKKYIFGDKWNTSNVKDMSAMFAQNYDLQELDLSMITMGSELVQTTYMFLLCRNLSILNISNMTFENVTAYSSMFSSINANATIVINECAEEFVHARLVEVNRSNVTLEVVPCIKVCYSNNSLPSEYTELEYIESTGTQYIDTGVLSDNNNLKIDIEYEITEFSSGWTYIFGAYNSENANTTRLIYNGNTGAYAYVNNRAQSGGTGNLITRKLNTKYIESLWRQGNTVYYSSNAYTETISQNPQIGSAHSSTIAIFSGKSNTMYYGMKMKLYLFKIYENGTLVRNYVPALRTSDNAIGLYETKEGKFYENSGTGVFNYSYGINKILIGNTIQLAHPIDARPGYTFVGWNTKPDGTGITFKQGEVVDANVLKSLGDGTITLYAMWEANN